MRRVMGAVIASTVMIVLVAAMIVTGLFEATDEPLAWALVGIGAVAGVAGTAWVGRQQLVCGPPESLANQYRTRLFVGIALAQFPALLGFVAAFLVDDAWPALVGLVPSLVGFGRIFPTAGRIAAHDRALQSSGCPHTLSAGWEGTAAGAPPAP
jgi:hypothetical protein